MHNGEQPMKKFLIVASCLSLMGGSAFAQGVNTTSGSTAASAPTDANAKMMKKKKMKKSMSKGGMDNGGMGMNKGMMK
jgi:hypothetical protein